MKSAILGAARSLGVQTPWPRFAALGLLVAPLIVVTAVLALSATLGSP